MPSQRIIVAITGASGICLAHAVLNALADSPAASSLPRLEVHLIISAAARQVIQHEGGPGIASLEAMAHKAYDPLNFAAPMASGSWQHRGMVVCPCSMASLAAIATGCSANLIHRAADVTIKERRPLILAIRETPLSRIHLTNMLTATDAGAIIMPPCPAWYANLHTLDDAATHFAARVLDQLGIVAPPVPRWGE